MDRRTLLMSSPLISLIASSPALSGDIAKRRISAGDMIFTWFHLDDQLMGKLQAPAPGWLAIGFNNQETLLGTRFIMAAVHDDGSVHAEERIAVPGGHDALSNQGGSLGLDHLQGARKNGTTELTFSLSDNVNDPNQVSLAPGSPTYLMLAWSHEADFAHHSAWRRHFDVTL